MKSNFSLFGCSKLLLRLLLVILYLEECVYCQIRWDAHNRNPAQDGIQNYYYDSSYNEFSNNNNYESMEDEANLNEIPVPEYRPLPEIQFGKNRLSLEEEKRLIEGFEIDFNYNETEDGRKLISVPGCPDSVKDIFGSHYDPWVYYGEPPKCYLTGSKGPCSEGMKLRTQSWTKYGECQCDCFSYTNPWDHPVNDPWDPFLKEIQNHCYSSKEEKNYAYFPRDKICYALLSQGPCESDEWFVLDRQMNPTCSKRSCPGEETELVNSYPRKIRYAFSKETNSCKKIGSQCEDRKFFVSTKKDWEPGCRAWTGGPRDLGYSINPSTCQRSGQNYSFYLKRCVNISRGKARVG